ncbi:MAG TPA: L-lactate permease [Aliidongia sp.]|uniref:L-lactate permease n=1 Tax=Aliidongia sp. TaxID=1914230 RepID=UPI002DDD4DBA|nr:L-lactate permease [Aliidongia sp.]HEV2676795.1 L-lactate permease [Aliidongia sp.]
MLSVALAPLLLVILLIASRRVSTLVAGLIGWVAALAAAWVLCAPSVDFPAWAVLESAEGAWLAWQAVAVILAGLFFYRVLRRHEAHLFQADGPAEALSRGRLWAVCFLLGPFAESATGFGVGAIVAMAALMRMGLKGPGAAVLALYSQMLVPWGGLAVGTIIGAHLAGEAETTLGLASAILTMPLLAGYLVLYWVFVGRLTGPVPLVQKIEDALWTALLAGAIWLANRYVATELGGVVAPGALLVLHFFLSRRPDWAMLRRATASALPFAILAALLIATRSIPPLTGALRTTFVLAPFADQPSFPVFYNPSFWLLLVGLGVMIATGRLGELPARLRETWTGGWRAALVTIAFVAMAQVLAAAGAARLVGEGLRAGLGPVAPLTGPLFGAVGGFLTGSNSASNGMMMAVQAALGDGLAGWSAALQNVAGSNFSMLSPVRVAMAAALIGGTGADAAIYRRAWPVAVMLLVVLLAEAALLTLPGSPVR